MTTKKNIQLLAIVALLVAGIVLGVCACETQKMTPVAMKATPTPAPNDKTRGPGPITH